MKKFTVQYERFGQRHSCNVTADTGNAACEIVLAAIGETLEPPEREPDLYDPNDYIDDDR